jgi:hypothetical protein
MMSAVLLASLEGAWSIVRSIHPGGSLAGTATFTRRLDGLFDYDERGELLLDGGRFATERRYLFEALPHGFAVFFPGEPRRLFHEVALEPAADGALVGAASHPCGPDMYFSSYRFAGDGFAISHRAEGPRKNYSLATTYTRDTARRQAA